MENVYGLSVHGIYMVYTWYIHSINMYIYEVTLFFQDTVCICYVYTCLCLDLYYRHVIYNVSMYIHSINMYMHVFLMYILVIYVCLSWIISSRHMLLMVPWQPLGVWIGSQTCAGASCVPDVIHLICQNIAFMDSTRRYK